MKKNYALLTILLYLTVTMVFSQTKAEKDKIILGTNVQALKTIGEKATQRFTENKQKALKMANEKGWVIREDKDGRLRELIGVTPEGKPLYYTTFNVDAAKSTRANTLHNGGLLGLNIEGQSMTAHVWDGGLARTTHQEYDGVGGNNRFSIGDGTTALHYHAAHVTGTIISSGFVANSKGMAPQALAIGYDWNNDVGEAITAAGAAMLLSNHSYGYGAEDIPDDWFGQYGSDAVDWDGLMYNAPYYLMCVAAGNDGDDNTSNAAPLDGNSSFDKLSGHATAKNNLVVANAQDANIDGAGNLISVSINSSSSEEPNDDYKIKPDITGKGTGLYSTYESADDAYNSITGTSMATPNVTGTLLLLQQYYNSLYGEFMKAATLKGLALHTADDAGTTGPDAIFGWGLMNAKKAAELIASKGTSTIIDQLTLANGGSYSIDVTASGTEDLLASISWTDPAGSANSGTNSSTPALVNDLDIRVTQGASTFNPYKLTSITTNTTGDNTVDPYERIDVTSPTAGTVYTITITHKGTLSSAQNYSLIVSGIAQATDKPQVVTAAISNITQISATSGGNVIDEGIATVTERGIVWSLNPNPTTTDNKVIDIGTGTGIFTCDISGLSAATTYYVRAYAINSEGTSYGENKSFVTECGINSLPYSQNFNESATPPLCWSMIEKDSDGNHWKLGGSEYTPHSGSNVMISASWASSALTPDNWLISPQFEVNADHITLKYYVKIMDTDWPAEKYSVLVSNTGTSTTDFSTIHTETLTATDNVWKEVILDIAGYNGDNIYIAFRHHDCTDMFQLILDDISIEEVPAGTPIIANTPNPANGQGDVSLSGNLTWIWAADTDTYDLWFGETGNMTKIVTAGTAGDSGTSGSYSYTNLNANTNYEWRVDVYNTTSGLSATGQTWGFITLCGSYSTLPFEQNFDASTSLPSCWSIVDNEGNGQVWQFGTGGNLSGASGNYAYVNSDAYGSGNAQNTDLITPLLDLSNYTNITVSFNHFYRHNGTSSGTLSYKIGENVWVEIEKWEASSTNPHAFSEIVTALAGQSQVKLKWNYSGSFDWSWSIDDISITGTEITNNPEPTNHATAFTVDNVVNTSITLNWVDATGINLPAGYLIKASNVAFSDISAPIDGTPEIDGVLVKNVIQGTETIMFEGLEAETTYYFKIFPYSNAGATINYKTDGTIPQIDGTTNVALVVYCTGGPSSTSDSNVKSVNLIGETLVIDHTGCPGVIGTEDLTAQKADLYINTEYPISVEYGSCGGNYAGAGTVWIDWNHNGLFETSEIIGTWTGTPPSDPQVYNFTVPADAFIGETRMRVMQRESGSLPLDPCGTYSWGSVMDFGIVISEIPANTYTVNFSVTGANGTLAATVDGVGITTADEVEEGKDVVFTATPADGYQVAEWTLNGTPVADNTTNSYTITSLAAASTVTVEFELISVSDVLVEWNFPNTPDDQIVDGSITENSARTISRESTFASTYSYFAGASTNCISTTSWDNGLDAKYWLIDLTTTGYENLTLSSKQRSSSTGPRDFKVQYKLDGTPWTDLPSGTVTTASDFTCGVLTNVALPSILNNQGKIYLR